MKKQYWTIIGPDGELLHNAFWVTDSLAWEILMYRGRWVSWEKTESKEDLIKKGYRVVKIWVEIEGE